MGKFFKALKFAASAMLGLPLATVASLLAGTLWAGVKTAEIFSKKYLKDYFGTFITTSIAWDQRLNAIEGWFPKIWSGFGFHAISETARFIGGNIEEAQNELGYGTEKPIEEQNHQDIKRITGTEEEHKNFLQQEVEKTDKKNSPLVPNPLPKSSHLTTTQLTSRNNKLIPKNTGIRTP